MQSAGDALLGEHDFSAFRAAGCQAATAVRELSKLSVRRRGEWIAITVRANAFLQHMVRNIVGALVAVGGGDRSPGWIAELLRSGDRTAGGVAAPAQGLTLVRVEYPARYELGTPALGELLPGLDASA